ncbi:hypothetical protein F2Q68_00036613, partial [Brassica cretica]
MKAAVDNGWGGRDSHEKANRTLSNVVDYFIHLKGFTFLSGSNNGLADILENGLYELNTVADDGSLEEVTETLLDWYYECLEGNEDDKESDDDDDDEDEDTNMNDDQTTDMMVDASEQKPEA